MNNDKDVYALLVKFDERQRTIFKQLNRIESHLKSLNGKVAEHERTIIELRTIGTVAIILIPILVSYVMRYFN